MRFSSLALRGRFSSCLPSRFVGTTSKEGTSVDTLVNKLNNKYLVAIVVGLFVLSFARRVVGR
jgi:hypothetical protein